MNPTDFIVKRFNIDSRYANHVPQGWIGLIFETLESIKKIDPNITLLQVKEKFASLNIYYRNGDTHLDVMDKVKNVVDRASELSMKTCQECGKEGKRENVGNWMYTLCQLHVKILTKRKEVGVW